jgi:predicted Zn-dependent peptidase
MTPLPYAKPVDKPENDLIWFDAGSRAEDADEQGIVSNFG